MGWVLRATRDMSMSWPTQARQNRNSAETGQPPARKSDTPRAPRPPNVPRGAWLAFLTILLVNYLLVRLFLPSPGEPVTIPYTVFKEEVAKGNVEAIYSKGTSI